MSKAKAQKCVYCFCIFGCRLLVVVVLEGVYEIFSNKLVASVGGSVDKPTVWLKLINLASAFWLL